jgi:hypothetical protein
MACETMERVRQTSYSPGVAEGGKRSIRSAASSLCSEKAWASWRTDHMESAARSVSTTLSASSFTSETPHHRMPRLGFSPLLGCERLFLYALGPYLRPRTFEILLGASGVEKLTE